MSTYTPMSLAELASHLRTAEDERHRRRLLLEFLEEFRWEPPQQRMTLLAAEPGPTGQERWDVLLGAVAEHLADQDSIAAPRWTADRTLTTWWFPDDTPFARADSFVRSPAAFRRRGIFIAEHDLARA